MQQSQESQRDLQTHQSAGKQFRRCHVRWKETWVGDFFLGFFVCFVCVWEKVHNNNPENHTFITVKSFRKLSPVDLTVDITAKYGIKRNTKYSTESSSSLRTHTHTHTLILTHTRVERWTVVWWHACDLICLKCGLSPGTEKSMSRSQRGNTPTVSSADRPPVCVCVSDYPV